MNLAVHGLSGDIKEGNTYYEDIHKSFGKFDFVMANPPFNVSGIDKERVRDDPRFRLGIPTTDNGELPLDPDLLPCLKRPWPGRICDGKLCCRCTGSRTRDQEAAS